MNLNEPLSRFIFNGSSIIGIFSVHKINILEMTKIVILGLDPGIQASLSCLDSLVKPGNDTILYSHSILSGATVFPGRYQLLLLYCKSRGWLWLLLSAQGTGRVAVRSGDRHELQYALH